MVNLSAEQIKIYCHKYKLLDQQPPYSDPQKRYYYDEKTKLTEKKSIDGKQAYSEEQINKLIFRRHSKSIVLAVINLHERLINLGLSPLNIFRIANNSGGANNLNAFINATEELAAQDLNWQSLGISIDDVVRIISHGGGANNIHAFIRTTTELTIQNLSWQSLGISINDAVCIISNGGGSNNLNAFIKATQDLIRQNLSWQSLGIDIKDVVRILSHNGGSNNLNEYIKTTQELISQNSSWQSLGISINDVVRILSRNGGSIKLKKVFQTSPLLFSLGFLVEDIIKLVILSPDNLTILAKFVHDLTKYFSNNEIISFSMNKRFKQNIYEFLQNEQMRERINTSNSDMMILDDIFYIDNESALDDQTVQDAWSSLNLDLVNYEDNFNPQINSATHFAPPLLALLDLCEEHIDTATLEIRGIQSSEKSPRHDGEEMQYKSDVTQEARDLEPNSATFTIGFFKEQPTAKKSHKRKNTSHYDDEISQQSQRINYCK
ncbi:MAG: hypothetical protein P1U74_10005 [Legionellaceae bacterium]|nr:hypothetical protein [Legionellaceae bacterium]